MTHRQPHRQPRITPHHPQRARLRPRLPGHALPRHRQELGIPERTARAWLQQIRTEMADDRKAARRTDLALAIERQLAISTAAWQGYERAARAERQVVAQFERPTSLEEPTPWPASPPPAPATSPSPRAPSAKPPACKTSTACPTSPKSPNSSPSSSSTHPPPIPTISPPKIAKSGTPSWPGAAPTAPTTQPPSPTLLSLPPIPAPSASPFLPQREGNPRGEAAGQDAAPSASPFLPQREGGRG